uniref:little elongation complex subunit 1 isoform X2 n=1 Tax=Pristiophorus japonicus TaxID=55135 RepID=UPI00398F25E1
MDCKTLRGQLDELLQKFAPLEKCKDEMDAMRVELEEKRSSIKMYQQTHLEFSELQQEQTRNDAVKKKLETRIKRMEETTAKQNAEIKLLKKEKKALERNVKKTQEKLMVQQKNGIKVLKDAQTQNSMQEVPTVIDKNKVKLLLDEIWTCIEKPNVQEKPNKGSTYSSGKRGNPRRKCKILRSGLISPSHISPLEISELPTSSPSHQLECDQEENDLSEMDDSLADEGLKSNSDSAFYDDKTVELPRQKDPVDRSSTDTDGDDDEQDALSQQLQEILDWTEPLPPQLSPLPCSPSIKEQTLFGDITDSSDDEGSNLADRSCSGSVSETDQLNSSGCTEVLRTDQSSTVEAGISECTVGELSAEKMDCTEAETEDLNEQYLTKTEVKGKLSDPCLIVGDVQCKNESVEAQSLFEDIVKDSDVTRTPEMYNADSLLTPNAVHEKDLTSPRHNYIDGMQRDDITERSKDTVVSVISNLKTAEPELESSNLYNKGEYGIGTCVKEMDKEELTVQEASSCGQLSTTFEEMEMEEMNCNSFKSDSQKDECTIASELPSDMEHTNSESITKEQIGTSTVEEVIPLSQLNITVVHGVAQDKSDECIPTVDVEMEENNCNSFTSNRQKGECTQTSLQLIDVEIPQADSLMKEQNLNKMEEITPPTEVYCSMETGVSQDKSKNYISTGYVEMEKINSGSSITDEQKDKCTLNSMPASDVKQTHTELVAEEHNGLDKMQAITPLPDFDCSMKIGVSRDKSKNCVSTEDTEMEKINSGSLISDNQKDKCTLPSELSNDVEEFAAKEQNGLDKMQATTVIAKTDSSVIADIAKDRSNDCVFTGGMEIRDVYSSSFTFDSPNNELTLPSEQEFIQQTQSDLIIKEKGSLNKPEEVASLKSDCSMVATVTQDSSKCFIRIKDMELGEVDSNGSTSDRPKDECASSLVLFNTQLVQAESATKGQDCLNKMEQTSPLVEFDSSELPGVIQDKCNDSISTQDVEVKEVSSNNSTFLECTLISTQSSIEDSQTKCTIKERDIITETKVSSFIESDCSFLVTDLAQDKSMECTSTVGMPNKYEKQGFLYTRSESTEDTEKVKHTVCESPVDMWNEGKDKLMENKKKERSDIGEKNNWTVKLSRKCLSSDQTATQFESNAFSTESSSPYVLLDSVGQEHFAKVGQNKVGDAVNNNVVESEENANSEKSEDIPLKSRKLPGNEIQLSASTPICKTSDDPQNSEAEVSMLIRKIKKRWHGNGLTPERETQETINHKVVEMEITTEVCTLENLTHELEVQTRNYKTETEQYSLSVNGHVTVQCAGLPFDSKSVLESDETVCNIESITNDKEELIAIHSDCSESKTELVTLDEGFSQDACQTPVLEANNGTNINSEVAGENGVNTMSVECEASALDSDNPALKDCDNETLSASSPNNDLLLRCTQIENKHLARNNCLQNDPEVVEKSKSSSKVCSNQDSNICTKEHFGIQINKNSIGITEEMPNCIASVKNVNNSTNTILEGSSSYISLVQKVDNSTQTELTYNGSQTVLYTSNDVLAAPKSVPQMDIVEGGKVRTPKAKKRSSYCDLWNPSLPDVPSDLRRPIHSVALHGREVLFESTAGNSVNMESFGTSECEQTSRKIAKSRKIQANRSLPHALIEGHGDVQQDGGLQKSKIQSTYKSRAVLRSSRGSNSNNPPVLANADTSAPTLCTQEIRQVMLEMGQPLPPLLPPLVATPPRTARATRPISPRITTSSVAPFCSPVDDLASPSKETSNAASVSPLFDHTQQKSPSMHSPSPLEFARNERIQSSPLQFCTATPKHAVPVPGRLPQSAGSTLPQENSVKILDAMYPNLSARARTLNILRGSVQLSMRGPADGENQAGAVNQIMGFKAINSTATAFVKAGSNSRSEGTKTDGYAKDLEQQQPVVGSTSNTMDRPKRDQMAAKRTAEDDGAGNTKRLKTENNFQHGDNTADLITPKEYSTVNVADATKPLYNGLVGQKSGSKTGFELFCQSLEPIDSTEEAVASALMKITKSCFDLLPVIRSHVFVGHVPQLPVLRDEEKEVICELSGKKDLTEALLMGIIKKLKAEKTILDGNCLQALSRVYVAICRQQGDLERARLLSYSILKEDFPDSSKLLLLIISVWQNIFSIQGPINKSMQAVAKQRAKGDVLNCLSAYLNWEKNPPLDVSCLVSSFLIAMQQSPKVRFQTSNEYGMDFNGDMWELIYAIDLLCSQQQWTWTHDCFIRKEVWPVMDKWMKRRKGHKNVLHIQDATVAGVMRLIGRLGQQGLKKGSTVAVKNIAIVINKFLQQAFQEGVPWPVQLSAVYAVYDLAPSNPKGALEALHVWNASVTEPIPSVASNCLMELETLCERLNSEIKKP